MNSFREYLDKRITESKINFDNVKYGNFWKDLTTVIGNEASVPGAKTLEKHLTDVVQYALEILDDYTDDYKSDIPEDNYNSIKDRIKKLKNSKVKIS